jgi:hypothetical protein
MAIAIFDAHISAVGTFFGGQFLPFCGRKIPPK